jgi:hypothetical protein
LTPASAAVTISEVGSGELMPSWYAPAKRDGLLASGDAGGQEPA